MRYLFPLHHSDLQRHRVAAGDDVPKWDDLFARMFGYPTDPMARAGLSASVLTIFEANDVVSNWNVDERKEWKAEQRTV